MGYIYKITNLVNDKIYIGKTMDTLPNRFSKHKYDAINYPDKFSPLHNAMRKYGVENFKIEPVEECEDEILSDREVYWIKYYNSYEDREIGYNATPGGEGNPKYDKEIFLSLWDRGYSQTKIAEIIGCERHTVSRYIKKYITEEERNARRHAEVWKTRRENEAKDKKEKTEYFLKLWNEGHSIKEIAQIAQCSINKVQRHIAPYLTTEQKRSRSGRKGEPVCKIDILTGQILESFPSILAAARHEGCTDNTIRAICKKQWHQKNKNYTYVYKKEYEK